MFYKSIRYYIIVYNENTFMSYKSANLKDIELPVSPYY